MEGIELKVHDKIISAPLIENRLLDVMVTARKDRIAIYFGGMSNSTEILDYYDSELELEDCLIVSLKAIEQVTEPIKRHIIAHCSEEKQMEITLKRFLALEKELIEEGLIPKR